MHPPRKKKPGAFLSLAAFTAVYLKKVVKEESGHAVPSIGSTESHDIWTERR